MVIYPTATPCPKPSYRAQLKEGKERENLGLTASRTDWMVHNTDSAMHDREETNNDSQMQKHLQWHPNDWLHHLREF